MGGEVGEIFVLTPPEEIEKGQPLLVTGKLARGELFQAVYLPLQTEARLRIALVRAINAWN